LSKIVYLFDLAWHMYRSYHSFGFMSANVNGMEKPTGHIFGVLSSISAVLRKEPTAKIVLCEDGIAPGKGLSLSYKQGRKKLQYNIMQDRDLIESLAVLHPQVMVAYNENAEADQVMYTMAKRYESQGYKVVVYSGDNDLLQALSENVSIYRGVSKEGENWITLDKYLNSDKMRKKFGCCPVELLATYRAIIGDSSDNLKGIERIPRELVLQLVPVIDLSTEQPVQKNYEEMYNMVKISHRKYVEEIEKQWYKIHTNYLIMRLTECKVLKKSIEPAPQVVKELKLNSWATFLEGSDVYI